MKLGSIVSQTGLLYRKHRKFLNIVLIFLGAYALLNVIGFLYKPLSPKELMKKENADAVKQYVLSFGLWSPIFFTLAQVSQVVIIPIPGQVVGFVAGYIFGWKLGTACTIIGQTVGSFIVFNLSRRFGRPFVERMHGAEAVKDLEKIFLNRQKPASNLYENSKESLRSHGLLTFFLIMLLPGFPDNLACFAAGLSHIPMRKLVLAAAVGRFPAALALAILGDGWSNEGDNKVIYIITGVTLLLTALYLWQRPRIEKLFSKSG